MTSEIIMKSETNDRLNFDEIDVFLLNLLCIEAIS